MHLLKPICFDPEDILDFEVLPILAYLCLAFHGRCIKRLILARGPQAADSSSTDDIPAVTEFRGCMLAMISLSPYVAKHPSQ